MKRTYYCSLVYKEVVLGNDAVWIPRQYLSPVCVYLFLPPAHGLLSPACVPTALPRPSVSTCTQEEDEEKIKVKIVTTRVRRAVGGAVLGVHRVRVLGGVAVVGGGL